MSSSISKMQVTFSSISFNSKSAFIDFLVNILFIFPSILKSKLKFSAVWFWIELISNVTYFKRSSSVNLGCCSNKSSSFFGEANIFKLLYFNNPSFSPSSISFNW